jgi:hypothetical protein
MDFYNMRFNLLVRSHLKTPSGVAELRTMRFFVGLHRRNSAHFACFGLRESLALVPALADE